MMDAGAAGIRPVRPSEDAPAITAIYNRYITRTTVSFETEPLSEASMQERIEAISSEFPYFVYEYDSEVAGYCYAHLWKERSAYSKTLEMTVYLAPEACGKGFGAELVRRLIEACRERGFHSLIACITAENTRSLAFHEALGFRKVSHFRQVGHKFGRWLDVIDLQLPLDDQPADQSHGQ